MSSLIRRAGAAIAPASSLTDMLAERAATEQFALLVCDCSGSMAESIDGARKIDRLASTVNSLAASESCRIIAFSDQARTVARLDPTPAGGTNLAAALALARRERRAGRIVVVSDGLPNNEAAALREATASPVPVHVVYIGPGNDEGYAFMLLLAAAGRGRAGYTGSNLRALEGSVRALLEGR